MVLAGGVLLLLVAAAPVFVEVSSSETYACARSAAGQVFCAISSVREGLTPVKAVRDASSVVVSGEVACALGAAGQAWCWSAGAARVSLTAPGTKSLHAFSDGVILLQADGSARCASAAKEPELCPELAEAVKAGHALVSRREVNPRCEVEGGRVSCAALPALRVPARVPLATPSRALATGPYSACALDAQGATWCWGEWRGEPSRDGPAPTAHYRIPVQASSRVARALGMAPTPSNTNLLCLVHDADEVACTRDHTGEWTSVRVPGAAAVALGADHACALGEGGRVWCWGVLSTALGPVRPASKKVESRPVVLEPKPLEVPGVTDVVELVAGMGFTCVRTRSGRVGCWGSSSGSSESFSDGEVNWVLDHAALLSASYVSACAVAAGRATCWSGAGRDTELYPPRHYGSLDGAEALAMGGVICKAVSGAASCQPTGQGLPADSEVKAGPILSGVKKLVSNENHACALQRDGKISCWLESSGDEAPVPRGPFKVLPVR